MSLKRTFAVRLPFAAGLAAASVLGLGLGGVFVCSPYPTYKDLPINCAAEDGYELYNHDTDPVKGRDLTLDNYNNWYASSDYTPDAGTDAGDGGTAASASGNNEDANKYVASATVTAVNQIPDVPDASVCGARTAVMLQASHNDDWGCLFGPWDFGTNAEDASDWDGIAFWARAPGNTSKGFTLSLGDDNSESGGSSAVCRAYSIDGGAPGEQGSNTGFNPSTGTPLSGSSTTRTPYPDECGNGYTTAMQVTSDWQFYTVPFGELQQALTPNRVPNSVFSAGTVPGTGLLTSRLRHLVIRLPKEAEVELWLADLAFYRKKAQ